MSNTITTLLLAGTLSLVPVAAVLAQDEPGCKTLDIGAVNWTDVVATTAIAKALFEELGYTTKVTSASQQIIFAGIRDKRLDFYLGYWKPLMTGNIKPFVDAGQVRILPAPSLDDARATLAVPDYLYDKGLKTFADIARFKADLGGKLYGIEPGSGINKMIQAMIDKNQFNLGDFQLVESSEAGMLSAVTRAVRRNDAVVFFGWAPHPMNLHYQMKYLSGSEDALGPNEGKATVWTVTDPDLGKRCPNVDRLLNNLTFTVDDESRMMEPLLAHEDSAKVAKAWLKDHPADRKRWLQGVTRFDGSPAN
ncbi:choline ABC transporter substrate-binding protein [Pseudomonas sp. v388]|uniref:choline ABC transporter substrate-binding protein n=1 Tax=Pseudomonas sp. v388 TaxID=2479849 RepID=UPI000F7AB5D4|nr:choline ABC transporter substrate-binding protein [Pseudomonas sp. v388]RRV10166.1 choline ABC transporter substrate-binding protein [Pseudomonas sp. v388]